MNTDIRGDVTTPDKVETRIGTLHYNDGVPTEDTAEKVWDQLDFSGAVVGYGGAEVVPPVRQTLWQAS